MIKILLIDETTTKKELQMIKKLLGNMEPESQPHEDLITHVVEMEPQRETHTKAPAVSHNTPSKSKKRRKTHAPDDIFEGNTMQNKPYKILVSHELEYKLDYGTHYRDGPLNIIQLMYIQSLRNTITYAELDDLSEKMNVSTNVLGRFVESCRQGVFEDYLNEVCNTANECKIWVMANQCVCVDDIQTQLRKSDALSLLFKIQNHTNLFTTIYENYREYSRFIDPISYMLLCLNYNDSEVMHELQSVEENL